MDTRETLNQFRLIKNSTFVDFAMVGWLLEQKMTVQVSFLNFVLETQGRYVSVMSQITKHFFFPHFGRCGSVKGIETSYV